MATRPGTIATATASEAGFHQLRIGKVEGGSKTNPMLISNVAANDFRAALESSLEGLQFLTPDQSAAKLEVAAYILNLDQPMVGLDMTVTSRIHYIVAPVSGGPAVLDDTVAASGTASFGSALLGVERLRKANEAAIRANIQSFVERLRVALSAKPIG